MNPLYNAASILQMYKAVLEHGYETRPRGQRCKNIRNAVAVFDANMPVITSFEDRKFNLNYAKKEWLWYIGGDRYDQSIEQYATLWAKIRQPDGSYFSNYGHYIFAHSGKRGLPIGKGTQYDFVVRTLSHDKDSRRAAIALLNEGHLFDENPDVVCTYGINFCIEDDTLHMTVMMRSNDVIFGFTNDAFCFWSLMQFVYADLVEIYPNLRLGTYTHFANSLHVYERHYEMIERIVKRGLDGYTSLAIPLPNSDDVAELLRSGGGEGGGAYGHWLRT
jgi:thymidylate synthase